MKSSIKKFERTLVFFLKMALLACLFFLFFLLFSIENPQIFRLSRTAAVTMVTFAILEVSLMSVYGGYALGRQKSRAIVHSMMLATILTDLVTYLQLCIMNTNPSNNLQFRFADPEILLVCIVLQIVVIVTFAYGGNYLYFKMNPPEKSCIITSSQYSLNRILPKINKYRLQYRITDIVDYRSEDVLDKILENDTIFLYDVPIEQRTHFIEYCYDNQKNIYYNPELCDVVAISAKNVLLDDKTMICSQVKELSLEQRMMKRAMDLILSTIALVIASPVMLICAAAIKLEDHGPVFFTQKRATKGGTVFRVYKFRTMKVHDENEVQVSAAADDDRITKIGAQLRRFRLDELPQIFNILKGEMSIVGPRPEMMENVYRYTEELPEFQYRLRVKAGLTGLAQIAGKYNTSPKDKLVLDLIYIENYSVWQDIKLIFQTLLVFLKSGDSTEGFSEENVVEFKKYDAQHQKEEKEENFKTE
ncbi:MAG: exopolysaccharide biosynthesis polyprenyl glycosylphosphotransferase [Massiliimalia sp.]